jgi:lipoate-protein ligase A
MLRLIRDLTPTLPAEGLALEEAILEHVYQGGMDTLRFWVNGRAVVIGRSQAAASEVDLAQARQLDIPVLRRISGGGAVYHYPGNLNLSLFLADARSLGTVIGTFSLLGKAITSALSPLGIDASVRENNLFIAGKKIGGAAQARRKTALLYHTTLLVALDTIPMERLLLAMRPGYTSTRVLSRPYATTTLTEIVPSLTLPVLVGNLTGTICDLLRTTATSGRPTRVEKARAEELAKKKYRSDRWNLSL